MSDFDRVICTKKRIVYTAGLKNIEFRLFVSLPQKRRHCFIMIIFHPGFVIFLFLPEKK